LEGLIAKKVCTACSSTSYRIVPLNNLNKYLYNDNNEIKGIYITAVKNLKTLQISVR